MGQLFPRNSLQPRDALLNKTDGYKWYGHPVGEGLPLPGNYSGFAGTLAEESIRVSNAFATGLIWFLVLLALLVLRPPDIQGNRGLPDTCSNQLTLGYA